jgi:hypothetical protein
VTGTPLFADALFGLRYWRVSTDDRGEWLTAPYHDTRWPPGGEWLHAHCPSGHGAPAPACDCGVHAWHPNRQSARDVLAPRATIAGIVEARGAVELHEDGFRAARCRPYALIATPRSNAALIRRLAERYGTTVIDVNGPRALLAWCREHDIGMSDAVVADIVGTGNPSDRRRARLRRDILRVAAALALSALLVVVGLAVTPEPEHGKTLGGRAGEVHVP